MKQTLFVAFLFGLSIASAQNFTRQDTLRGSITPERQWWDLNHYDLNVKVEPSKKYISGYNVVRYKVLKEDKTLQIDLQEPLKIESITQDGKKLKFSSEGNAHFIKLKKKQVPGTFNELKIEYSGYPKEAVRAPWDGGFSWKKDENGKHFVATSCQGLGASVWWPNKDHMYDEVDSMRISVTVPNDLMDVSNGQLESVADKGDFKTYNWVVKNPINNYGVNVNIADYTHFGEMYEGEKGPLQLDYYVLPNNLEKAKKQFVQTPMMLQAFEHWFGPYPFYEDGFKLVEVPYLGMEHQSSVTYGNNYENGYLGRDLSGTGWGLQFDFIIIHEAGHEWFANNITYKDIADMWVHEGFTAYSENLYLDYHFGEQAANEYVQGLRAGISNDRPIQGVPGVYYRGSGDMYNKGGNMLHTIRQIVNDDELWRQTLRGLNREFRHQTVTSNQVEEYIIRKTGLPLESVFDQYVRDIRIPTLEYQFRDGRLRYRWGNAVEGFMMPVDVTIDGERFRLGATDQWQSMDRESDMENDLIVDPNYYVGSFNLLGEK